MQSVNHAPENTIRADIGPPVPPKPGYIKAVGEDRWGPGEEMFVVVRHKTKFWYNPNVNNIDSFFVFNTSYA